MSEQTPKSGNIVVNKKEFHTSKQAIALSLVDTDKIIVSDKTKYSDNCSKYSIGYLDDDDDDDDDIIRTFIILLIKVSVLYCFK